MLTKIIDFMTTDTLEVIDNLANKIGVSSIVTTLGLTATQDISELSPVTLTDYALYISMFGGLLFIVEKIILIYIRYRQSKKLDDDDKN